jgi:uncharacterized protein YabN with tetrapyrrole methylase and pyrophosphatase domain
MLKTSASLVVVGSGIKSISHLTTEAKAYIEQSNKVLYLLNEPAMKSWIQRINANAESLDPIYTAYPLREQSYLAITNHILNAVRQNQHVCVALYGHPAVFATPALEAVVQAKQEGYFAKVLPGISSEDCLFADLLIDPASHGCLSLEATDLLVHRRKIDVSCHVILWQVSVIGMLGHEKSYDNQNGLNMLYAYLIKYYPLCHELILYSASQYPGLDPMIKKFPLGHLREMQFTRVTTLYVPPLKRPMSNKKALAKLKII